MIWKVIPMIVEPFFYRGTSPFGEVVDYLDNSDGTLTLYVDAVWPDRILI